MTKSFLEFFETLQRRSDAEKAPQTGAAAATGPSEAAITAAAAGTVPPLRPAHPRREVSTVSGGSGAGAAQSAGERWCCLCVCRTTVDHFANQYSRYALDGSYPYMQHETMLQPHPVRMMGIFPGQRCSRRPIASARSWHLCVRSRTTSPLHTGKRTPWSTLSAWECSSHQYLTSAPVPTDCAPKPTLSRAHMGARPATSVGSAPQRLRPCAPCARASTTTMVDLHEVTGAVPACGCVLAKTLMKFADAQIGYARAAETCATVLAPTACASRRDGSPPSSWRTRRETRVSALWRTTWC